jgi:hypothetical protein
MRRRPGWQGTPSSPAHPPGAALWNPTSPTAGGGTDHPNAFPLERLASLSTAGTNALLTALMPQHVRA